MTAEGESPQGVDREGLFARVVLASERCLSINAELTEDGLVGNGDRYKLQRRSKRAYDRYMIAYGRLSDYYKGRLQELRREWPPEIRLGVEEISRGVRLLLASR